METITTYTIVIYFRGEEVRRFENQQSDLTAFKALLRMQGNSINYALKFGGYEVTQTDEQTGESSFWKYYA